MNALSSVRAVIVFIRKVIAKNMNEKEEVLYELVVKDLCILYKKERVKQLIL